MKKDNMIKNRDRAITILILIIMGLAVYVLISLMFLLGNYKIDKGNGDWYCKGDKAYCEKPIMTVECKEVPVKN